jgi:hypothetical protein
MWTLTRDSTHKADDEATVASNSHIRVASGTASKSTPQDGGGGDDGLSWTDLLAVVCILLVVGATWFDLRDLDAYVTVGSDSAIAAVQLFRSVAAFFRSALPSLAVGSEQVGAAAQLATALTPAVGGRTPQWLSGMDPVAAVRAMLNETAPIPVAIAAFSRSWSWTNLCIGLAGIFVFKLVTSPLFARRMQVYYTSTIIIGTMLYLKRTKRWRQHLSDAEENAVWDKANERLARRALKMIQQLKGFWVKVSAACSAIFARLPRRRHASRTRVSTASQNNIIHCFASVWGQRTPAWPDCRRCVCYTLLAFEN